MYDVSTVPDRFFQLCMINVHVCMFKHSVSTILCMHLFMGLLARVFEVCSRILLAGWRHGDVTIWRFVEICAFKKVKQNLQQN